METLFAWLHLSDLHVSFTPENRGTFAPSHVHLKEDVAHLIQSTVRPHAILITGDLSSNGRDYFAQEDWLQALTSTLNLERDAVFVIPGNHDIDREAHRDRSVSRLLRALREDMEDLDSALEAPEDRELLAQRFRHFSKCMTWLDESKAQSALFWMRLHQEERCTVRIVGLNTALLATSDDDHGKLRVGQKQLSQLNAPEGQLVVALMHHPVSWLADGRAVAAALSNHAHVVICGHAHSGSAAHSTPYVMVEAGSDGTHSQFSYNVAAVMADTQGALHLRVWPRRWSSKNMDFRTDVDQVPDGQTFFDHPLQGLMLNSGPSKPFTAQILGASSLPASRTLPCYLSRIEIKNLRSLHSVEWPMPARPGWHVVIGDNGSGKSSFLRAISVALLGASRRFEDGTASASLSSDNFLALRVNFDSWIRKGEISATVSLWMRGEDTDGEQFFKTYEFAAFSEGQRWGSSAGADDSFSAGFGPFRRFSGGDTEYERQFVALPRVARHLSLFDERVSMTEALRWLKDLEFKALESAKSDFLDQLKLFINQEGFLPNKVRLISISSETVRFADANGTVVAIEELSDGYRSILSLTLELIRQLAAHYGDAHVFSPDSTQVLARGIVLLDEADVHLHPTWQRELGQRLKKLFPYIQFIVTTHSPLVCQAADTIFRLPRPGTEEQGRVLEEVELERLRYGNILDAYGTGVFGRITRSEEGKRLLDQLAELNLKEIEKGLSPEEEQRQEELRAIFPTERAPKGNQG